MTIDLNTIWFILIAILYTGFFVLEGFDFGVGMLLPFLGKEDKERRMVINTIGPHWDGNEVWLLTAGGATFAAFPHWYATMFSGFYLALFLLLLGLIVRGVAFEFRSKREDARWRSTWDWCIFVGSLLPALLLGVAFSNLVRGLPINADMMYTGGFWYLLNPYSLLGGVVSVALFLLHGSIFLSLKSSGVIQERAEAFARKAWLWVTLLFFAFVAATYASTDLLMKLGVNPGLVPLIAALAILLSGVFIRRKNFGIAFTMTALNIIATVSSIFLILFPRVMISTTNPDYSLTIYNASSSDYTLTVMSIIALIFVPIVLGYQIWSYVAFKRRVTSDPKDLTY
jgi:cytochrome d ubiquinol oxidase subunit II